MKEDSPKMAFAAVKKVINDVALNHSTQKTWENFAIVLNLKLPGLKVNCYKDCNHLKMTRLCSSTE